MPRQIGEGIVITGLQPEELEVVAEDIRRLLGEKAINGFVVGVVDARKDNDYLNLTIPEELEGKLGQMNYRDYYSLLSAKDYPENVIIQFWQKLDKYSLALDSAHNYSKLMHRSSTPHYPVDPRAIRQEVEMSEEIKNQWDIWNRRLERAERRSMQSLDLDELGLAIKEGWLIEIPGIGPGLNNLAALLVETRIEELSQPEELGEVQAKK